MEPASVEEQRVVIKFLSKLGKNGREIFADLRTVYGDDAVKEPTVHKWLKRFREGRESVQDDPRSGRPSTSHSDENVERIRTCVNGDRRLTVRQSCGTSSSRIGARGALDSSPRQCPCPHLSCCP
ncbi:protein GVQW3-like [Galleria mellonella]|uniref:Protein GVQW3-like n=1 Tax=Galleria mellonella TaxID=7137 RepID=A0ABM3MXB1_GALME|nr:protein GVQW3-like [Galleria mellonella]